MSEHHKFERPRAGTTKETLARLELAQGRFLEIVLTHTVGFDPQIELRQGGVKQQDGETWMTRVFLGADRLRALIDALEEGAARL